MENEMAQHDRFHYKSLDELKKDIVKMGLDMPVSSEVPVPFRPIGIGGEAGASGRPWVGRKLRHPGMAAGLDAVIMDPLDGTMAALVYATEALVNKDRFCMKYVGAYRQGRLKA